MDFLCWSRPLDAAGDFFHAVHARSQGLKINWEKARVNAYPSLVGCGNHAKALPWQALLRVYPALRRFLQRELYWFSVRPGLEKKSRRGRFPSKIRAFQEVLPCLLVLSFAGCRWPRFASSPLGRRPPRPRGTPRGNAPEQARNRMVDEDVIGAGIKDPRVIQSMRDHSAARVRAEQVDRPGLFRHVAADRRSVKPFRRRRSWPT